MPRIRISVLSSQVSASDPSQSVRAFLESLKDGQYWLEAKRVSERQTQPQRGYFHSAIVPAICEETGYVSSEMSKERQKEAFHWMKEALKAKYKEFFPLSWRKDPLRPKRRITERAGTADLDKEGYSKFISAIIADFPWIPPPTSPGAMEFYDEMLRRYDYQ